ncbi:MAG: c-type cytochrome [Bryobacteraceae bacterium]|nr:c-type cytochrome [Bryobacteraceae bacterium]
MKLALLAAALTTAAFAQEFSGPAQAKKGYEFFFGGTSKGAACGTCHAMKGKGTAVGPNLVNIARVPARAMVMAINSTRTQHVQAVKTKTETFPGMKAADTADGYEIYDLNQNPPALKKFPKAEVSMTDNASWKHPVEAMKLSAQELADIIAYIKFAAYGDKAGVKAEDIE